jgi:hypothetical protein
MPGKYKIKLEQFGELKMDLESSRILTREEGQSLKEMTKSKHGILLYRASRDGFESKVFHEKCDGKANTITLIETDGNYVFGGFTTAKWSSSDGHIADSKAFVFSLRRNGESCMHKFIIKEYSNQALNLNWRSSYYASNTRKTSESQYFKDAILGYPMYGPIFGNGPDFLISDKSNINIGSYTYLGETYHYPNRNKDRESFLAGSFNEWLTTEIEVYQINK